MLNSRGLGARKREALGPRGRTLPARLLISLAASTLAILSIIARRNRHSGPPQAGKVVQTTQAQQQRRSILAYVGVQVIEK